MLTQLYPRRQTGDFIIRDYLINKLTLGKITKTSARHRDTSCQWKKYGIHYGFSNAVRQC